MVVGAAAVGNEVLKNLCLLGVGRIHVIDSDRIEEHNLSRSVLFKASDIGKPKGEVAAAACKKIDPNVDVSFSTTDFWMCLSLEQLKRFNAVRCCVDNLEARVKLNHLCLIAQVDLLNAGIDSRRVCIEVYPFSSEPDCACYECALPPSAYSTMRDRYSCGWLKKIAYEERQVPTTAITSSIAGAYLTSIFLQRQSRHPDRLQDSTRCYIDTITFSTSVSKIGNLEECPSCGRWLPECHHFKTKRQKIANDITGSMTDKAFSCF